MEALNCIIDWPVADQDDADED
uniref:Uncharacterized protein n=1 Tax=Tetranychus urticae TaxID=32264 RepID=T1KRF6_TETUR